MEVSPPEPAVRSRLRRAILYLSRSFDTIGQFISNLLLVCACGALFIAHLLSRTIRVEADLVDQLFNSSEKRLARLLLLLANFGKEDKHFSGLKKPRDLAAIIEIDLGCRRHLRQTRHGHDLAAHHNDELRAGGKPDFADVDLMVGWRAAQLCVRRERILGFGDANGIVAVAALLKLFDLRANLRNRR